MKNSEVVSEDFCRVAGAVQLAASSYESHLAQMKSTLRAVSVALLSSVIAGCMIPLPPHGARTESHIIGERKDAEGRVVETITDRERYIYGRWLLHPTSTFDEWHGRVRHNYFLDDVRRTKKTELKFLANSDYSGWGDFRAITNAPQWWGYVPLHFGTNEWNSIAVFDSIGFKHIRKMPNWLESRVEAGERALRFRGTNGWWIYRILEDEFVVADPTKK